MRSHSVHAVLFAFSVAACTSSSTSSPPQGSDGGGAGGDGGATPNDAGDGGSSVDASTEDAPSSSGKGRVFVTSTAYGADLDTASGGPGTSSDGTPFGDVICNAAATKASLGGTWKAWLSSSTTGALERVAGTGPWTLIDGTTVVFASHAGLASAALHAIDHDERGNPAPPSCVWTGTDNGGVLGASFCNAWTSVSTGNTAVTGNPVGTADWTNAGTAPCNSVCRLYCFEQ